MPAGNIAIRPADAADAADLAAFARASFRTTYSATHDPGRIDIHCATALSDASFHTEIATDSFLVALGGGRIIAFAQLRHAAMPVLSEAVADRGSNAAIELRRFYVDPSEQGRGLAQRMFDAVASCARAMDGNVLWLGVFPGNARAIAFYQRQGFAEIGRVAYTFVDQTEEDLALALSLNANSA